MVVAYFLYCDVWGARPRVIQQFGHRALNSYGKVGSTSEIGSKCATNSEHIEVHV